MHFSHIIGYQDIKKKLCHLIAQGKIPQAQLISGPIGSPVLPFALAIASYLQCQNKKKEGACGVCGSCQKVEKHLHPDIYFSFPIGNTSKSKAANKQSPTVFALPSWRSSLVENPYQGLQEWASHLGQHAKQMKISTAQIEETIAFLRTHPLESGYKIVIIWLPEHIYPPAAHKLLKTLEEPPVNTFFILASHDPSSVLPTVSSRTWPLTIPPFQDTEVLQALTIKYPHASPTKLEQVARTAAGNLLMAYDLASEEDHHHFEPFAMWLRNVYAHQWGQIIDMAEKFAKSTPTEQKTWILYALRLMRATLMSQCKQGGTDAEMSAQDTFCKKLGQTISFSQLAYIINALEDMYRKLARNAHPKLLFIDTSLCIVSYFNETGRNSPSKIAKGYLGGDG